MVGNEVQKYTFDAKAQQCVTEFRNALEKARAMVVWFGNNPIVAGVDPLSGFGYSETECELLRSYFAEMNQIRVDNEAFILEGRKFTGLE